MADIARAADEARVFSQRKNRAAISHRMPMKPFTAASGKQTARPSEVTPSDTGQVAAAQQKRHPIVDC